MGRRRPSKEGERTSNIVANTAFGRELGVPASNSPEADSASPPPRRRRRRHLRWFAWSILLLLIMAAGAFFYREAQTSALQARYLSDLARRLTFQVEPGPAPANSLRFPEAGPYDERMGYTQLPQFVKALTKEGFPVMSQARISPEMRRVVDQGLFPVYKEKDQGGLLILDRYGEQAFVARYPERVYESFDSIPAAVVRALLFIENRELLDPRYTTRNPAIEWDRFAKALIDYGLNVVSIDDDKSAGGSTLATQIEKYRHSPGGLTTSGKDKLRQMASASLRSYLEGPDTVPARRRIVLQYINTVPLAARVGYGEINGIGDGLWAWYGVELDEAGRLLRARPAPGSPEARDQARVYKQVLSLFIAQRRPSYYLNNPDDLNQLSDVYLDLLTKEGIIGAPLHDEARAYKLKFKERPRRRPTTFSASKANNAVRGKLASVLGVPRLYDLDRLDVTVQSTLDAHMQAEVTKALRSLRDPARAKEVGLYGERLLAEGDDLSPIVMSFTLMERTDHGNVVRIQTDNYDQPFDINQGVKLDLGSTAKLRTMVTYLNVIAALHERYGAKSSKELAQIEVHENNVLARWAIDHLLHSEDHSLAGMLEAAMERKYSANPGQAFFTGGGLHTFENFNKEDNGKFFTVRDALRDSVNLVFVRMMRDIVRYYMWQMPGSTANILHDANDPRRAEYLARFADREGTQFVQRFYRKYQGKAPEVALDELLDGIRLTPVKLAVIYNSITARPERAAYERLLEQYLPANTLTPKDIESILNKYTPANYNLLDRGYIARVHPLELWVLGYLRVHPKATWNDVVGASKQERQEVYRWLYKTRHKNAQDSRIRLLLEVEAFSEILRDWKRVGYPFDSLVPSYATSIGSSADRPAALAELMGILVNDGVRYPVVRIEGLHFAEGTPYETVIGQKAVKGERVLPPEVARAARNALIGVVEGGTARRLGKPFVREDGAVIPVGGKTGTGDNRFEVHGRGGRLLQSRVMSRTATFVFFIGDKYFGTLTAYVPGAEAGKYKFTSALPVQILKALAPTLAPIIEGAALPTPPQPPQPAGAPDNVPPQPVPQEEIKQPESEDGGGISL